MAETTGLDLLLPLSIGTGVMLVLAIAVISFIVYYQKKLIREQIEKQTIKEEAQQRMLAAAIESQEAERKRIAKDLHDEIGAMLAALKLGLVVIEGETVSLPQAAEKAHDARTMVEDTLKNVRRISHDLMPAALEKFGLIAALEELSKKFSKTSGIDISLTQSTRTLDLEPSTALAIYRIVQEILNNALKHADARKIDIDVQKTGNQLYLSVADDGKGFDLEAATARERTDRGLGLSSMDSRASLIGASIKYDTHPGSGTRVDIRLPLGEKALSASTLSAS